MQLYGNTKRNKNEKTQHMQLLNNSNTNEKKKKFQPFRQLSRNLFSNAPKLFNKETKTKISMKAMKYKHILNTKC